VFLLVTKWTGNDAGNTWFSRAGDGKTMRSSLFAVISNCSGGLWGREELDIHMDADQTY
jgi:hypothetical protein